MKPAPSIFLALILLGTSTSVLGSGISTTPGRTQTGPKLPGRDISVVSGGRNSRPKPEHPIVRPTPPFVRPTLPPIYGRPTPRPTYRHRYPGYIVLPGSPTPRPLPTPIPPKPKPRPTTDMAALLGLKKPEPTPKPTPIPPPKITTPMPRPAEINQGANRTLHTVPTWSRMPPQHVAAVQQRVKMQVPSLQQWQFRHPERIKRFQPYGSYVQGNWWGYHQKQNWFRPNWWRKHPHAFSGWHYSNSFYRYHWNYWWTGTSFRVCVGSFPWSTRSAIWMSPVYYDFGTGGNVVIVNNNVYINGIGVASLEDYTKSAALLATVPPPDSELDAVSIEWVPLGTYAVKHEGAGTDPKQILQLAINKEGIISGTVFDIKTHEAYSVQGRVDKETQRVAFRYGEDTKRIIETGLYNLTQDEAQLLVHHGTERTSQLLLVRLKDPVEDDQ